MNRLRKYFVYILKCSDNSYYTGVTNNLERRLTEHHQGIYRKSYTHNRRPLALVFYTDFTDVNQAIGFEKQVKGWSRKKKEALMDRDWGSLHGLAVCKNQTSHKNYKPGFDSAQPDTSRAQVDTSNAQVDTNNAQVDTSNAQVDTSSAQVDTSSVQVDTFNVQVDTSTTQAATSIGSPETDSEPQDNDSTSPDTNSLPPDEDT